MASPRFPTIVLSVAASAAAVFGAVSAVRAVEAGAALGQTVQAIAGDSALVPVAAACHFHDGSYTGQVFDAYYGEVQVQANISGGCVASIEVLQYPADRRTSRRINDQALPMLQSEVLRAQSGRIDVVSGATLTSRAYIASLRNALAQAGP